MQFTVKIEFLFSTDIKDTSSKDIQIPKNIHSLDTGKGNRFNFAIISYMPPLTELMFYFAYQIRIVSIISSYNKNTYDVVTANINCPSIIF